MPLADFLIMIISLVVVFYIAYNVNTLVSMAPKAKNIFNLIVLLLTIHWLLVKLELLGILK